MDAIEQTTPSPFIIGVAGGSGSGKTTVSRRIRELVGDEHLAYIQHDSYYYNPPQLTFAERAARNYDHPESLQTELLVEHVRQLRRGHAVDVPIYDFPAHLRTNESERVEPARILLIEGILIFAERELRELMDLRIYVDTDSDLRVLRRLRRDIEQRGRTLESVVEQYLQTVRPMHLRCVEPSKRYAHIIMPEGGHNEVALEMVASRLKAVLEE